MSGPLLPSDLQLDVGMSVDEVNSMASMKDNNRDTDSLLLKDSSGSKSSNAHQLIPAYSSTVDSDGRWNHASTTSSASSSSVSATSRLHSSFGTAIPLDHENSNNDNSPTNHQLGLFSDHSSPGQPGSFLSSSSTSGFDDLRTPCRFSEQSPADYRERSEASLTSAIAAISYMAHHTSSGASPFPSLDGLSNVPHELDSGEKTTAAEGRNKGCAATHSRSHPILQTQKVPQFSGTSDPITSATHDFDLSTLLRILTPQNGKGSFNIERRQSDSGNSAEESSFTQEAGHQSQQTLRSLDNQSSGGGDDHQVVIDDDTTPCQLQIPLFGNRRAAHLLADLPNRLMGCSSEAALSSLISAEQRELASVETVPHPTATSCTDLGRRSGEDLLEDEEGSDTVEPLDSFLQHALGTRRRCPIPKQPTHFQSPSSGTFLNKSYYGGDAGAQDALKRLLECFSSMPQQQPQDPSFMGSAAAAAATALKDKHRQSICESDHDDNVLGRSDGTREALRHIQGSTEELRQKGTEVAKLGDQQQKQNPPSLYLSPIGGGVSINSQESLSPCGRGSQVTIGGQRNGQGAATAPAAMITDAEAMLASLLNSLGNQTNDQEESSNSGNGGVLVRDDSKGSISSQHAENQQQHYTANNDWAQPIEDDEIHDLNQQLNRSTASSIDKDQQDSTRWDETNSRQVPISSHQQQQRHLHHSHHHLFAPSETSSYYRPSASDTRDTAQRRVAGSSDEVSNESNSNNWRSGGLGGIPKNRPVEFRQRNVTEFDQHQRERQYVETQQHYDMGLMEGSHQNHPYDGRSNNNNNGGMPLRHHSGLMGQDEGNVQMYDNNNRLGNAQSFRRQSIEEPRHHQYFSGNDVPSLSSSTYFNNRDPREGYDYGNNRGRHTMYSNSDTNTLNSGHPSHDYHFLHSRMVSPAPLLHGDDFGSRQHYHHHQMNEVGQHPGFPEVRYHHLHDGNTILYDHSSMNNDHLIGNGGYNSIGGGLTDEARAAAAMKRVYSDDRDRMVYVSWIPKKARAYNTIDKRKMELDLKRKLREDLTLIGLTKVLLFPPKGVHCKLIFDSRPSAANFMAMYGGENRSEETERWKIDLCRIYNIDMHDKFDKTVVKIEWSQK